jgi:hypothetical protein
MTDEQIHNIYLHMSGKAEGIAEVTGSADFPVLFARAILEFSRKEWVGLTDDEILEEYRQAHGDDGNLTDVYFAHAIEAKLKEKNGG